MAITVDSTTEYDSGAASSSTASFSHTVGSGSDRILIVNVNESRLVTISSVTFNLVSMTLVTSVVSGNSSARSYQLINPPIGTYTVVVTYNIAITFRLVGAISLFGVDQSSPIGATNTKTGTAQNKTIDITTTQSNSLIIDGIGALGGVHTPTAGQTIISGTGTNRVSAYEIVTTATTYSQTRDSTTSAEYSSIVFEIKESTGIVNNGRFFNFF